MPRFGKVIRPNHAAGYRIQPGSAGEVYQVKAVLQQFYNFNGVLNFQSVRRHLIPAQPRLDEEIRAYGPTDALQNHPGKPDSIFQAAAILILPVVEHGRQEPAQKPAVPQMEVHHIQASLLGGQAGVGVMVCYQLHILFRHLPTG